MLEVNCAHHRGVAVAERVKPPADLVQATNLLVRDPLLFDMYMRALDVVLVDPEIVGAFDEYGLSAGTVRMKMVSDANRVLSAAPREFVVYKDALADELHAVSADLSQISHGSHQTFNSMLRRFWISASAVGALLIVGGVASLAAWWWTAPLVWAGGTILTIVTALWVVLKTLGTDWLLRIGLIQGGSPEMVAARDQLMAAVHGAELLAQVRTLINTARHGRFDHTYTVAGSPGLSEVYDSANRVPTNTEAELDGLLGRLDGASIGVAGPRGSGKSTLIHEYCADASSLDDDHEEFDWASFLDPLPERAVGDLRCMVSAPVDYVARDFVLHLFAAFCRAVIGSYGRKSGERSGAILAVFWLRLILSLTASLLWRIVFYGAIAGALLYWQGAIAQRIIVPESWVKYAAIAVIGLGALDLIRSLAGKISRAVREVRGGAEEAMAAIARGHLARVRYLQTYTSGWSGALRLPGGTEAQHSRGVSRAEQPLSYPEIVDEFRNFARGVAADVHGRGYRVFIGVDELDKIGSPDQAEHFLNEIKGIFGIPHVYFIVSVSDDALTAFERRGLPLRDAFDSSFDEIIHVGPLSYTESRRLLYRRVIGLTEPYVALCHCLAGGLARDLIRAARHVVRAATTLTAARSYITTADAAEYGIDTAEAYLLLRDEPADQSLTFGAISAAVVQDELRRKQRAISQALGKVAPANAAELQGVMYDIARHLALGQPIVNIVDLIAKPGQDEPPLVTSLRLDFGAYAYYCATLQEVFTDELDPERMIEATSEFPVPRSFNALAAARNIFTLDTPLAWRLITQVRKAWSLETREPIRARPSGAQ
jgi:hypothetical protein